MTKHTILTTTISATLALLSARAMAHPDGHDGSPDPLHVVDGSYSECFFDLHPELTQDEFDQWAKEGATVMHDNQLAGAEAIGRGQIEVSVDYNSTAIDDSKGAWNNTMSHPDADHYLGHNLAFPKINVRVGVSRRVEVGTWGTLNPWSNYGFVGLSSKITVLEQRGDMPVSVAVRPTAVALLGPKELFAADTGADFSVSRYYKGLSPYAGIGAHTSIAVERSDQVDLDPGTAAYMTAFAGLAYQWKKLRVAGEAQTGALTTYAMRIGGSF
jgi:hypothetical protein